MYRVLLVFLITLLLKISVPVQAQWKWVQNGPKLIASDNTGEAFFGQAVGLSADGKTAIIGGDTDDSGTGAAWIYTFNGTNFVQLGSKLIGTGGIFGRYGPHQGFSVDISADGKIAVVGGCEDNYEIGAVWVYSFNGSNFVQLGNKLVGTGYSYYPQQGWSVSISADGKTIITGGVEDYDFLPGSDEGAAWIYTFNGSNFVQFGNKLKGTGGIGSAQGTSVSISADAKIAVVGGYGDNSGIGAAWVYSFDGSNYVQLGNKLVGTGNTGISYQGQSVSISADGKTIVVGGDQDDTGTGALWVYTFNGTGFTQFGEKLAAKDFSYPPRQGHAVDISADGKIILDGSINGDLYAGIWVFSFNGSDFEQTGNRSYGSGGIGNSNQGNAVSISADGQLALVGGISDNNSVGAAWTFSPHCFVPTITGISSISGACQGQDLVLSVTSINLPQSYQWYKNNIFISGATTLGLSLTGISSASDGIYTCEIRNNCSSITSPGIVLTVKTTPTITGGIFPATVCNGESVLITATGAPVLSISGDAILGTNFTPITSQIYTITGIASNGCIATKIFSVTVNSVPSIIFSGNNFFCPGTAAYITVSGANNYRWSNNSTTSAIVVSPPASTNYTVTSTGSNGCTSIDVIPVTLGPVVTIPLPASTSVCRGDSAYVNVSGVSSLRWSNNATTTSIALLPTSNITVSFTGTTIQGCLAEGQTAIIIKDLPQLIVSGNRLVCKGESIQLALNGANTYKWSNNLTNTVLTVSPSLTTDYVVTGTGTNGCTNTVTINVTVNSSPILDISGSQTICIGTSTILTISGADTYIWSNHLTNSSISVSPSISTNYLVTGTGLNGCFATAGVSVIVNNLPKVSLNMFPFSNVCDSIGSIHLSGGMPMGGNYFYAGMNSSILDISKAGSYSVTYLYTSSNQCTGTATGILLVEHCIPYNICNGPEPPCRCNNTCPLPFKIYSGITPNYDGYNDTWIIDSLQTGSKLTILDKWGNRVFHTEDYLNNWDGKQDGEQLSGGIYYYILETEQGKKKYSGTVSIII